MYYMTWRFMIIIIIVLVAYINGLPSADINRTIPDKHVGYVVKHDMCYAYKIDNWVANDCYVSYDEALKWLNFHIAYKHESEMHNEKIWIPVTIEDVMK